MPACLWFRLNIRGLAYSKSTAHSFVGHFSFHYRTPHGGILQDGLLTVDSLIKFLIKHGKLRVVSGLKTLTSTIKAVDTKVSRCRLSTKQVFEEHDPTAQGWTRQKKKTVLVCGISVKREIKSVHRLMERNAWHSRNKTVAKIQTCCLHSTVTEEL